MEQVLLNVFSSVQEPTVIDTIPVERALEIIRGGGPDKALIEEARKHLFRGDKEAYDSIKKNLLCISWSFTFSHYRSTEFILGSTQLLSIEIDNDTLLPNNPLIYLSYKTLSTQGRAIIVKTENITPENYRYNYDLISKELGVNADINSAKPTQPFILSHDVNLYYNIDSTRWLAQDKKKAQPIAEKKRNMIGTELGSFHEKVRFSNIDDHLMSIDFNGDPLYDFGRKISIASLFINNKGITEGNRNNTLYAIGYQFRCLNTFISRNDLKRLLRYINRQHCRPALPEVEIRSIISSIMKIPEENLVLDLNDTKRFFFNPDYDLTTKEKRSLVMTSLNKSRASESKKVILSTVMNWDFKTKGKITQKKLAEASGLNIKTIKKHFKPLKELVSNLNNTFKSDQKN